MAGTACLILDLFESGLHASAFHSPRSLNGLRVADYQLQVSKKKVVYWYEYRAKLRRSLQRRKGDLRDEGNGAAS